MRIQPSRHYTGQRTMPNSLATYKDLFVYVYKCMENGCYFPKSIPVLQGELEPILCDFEVDSSLCLTNEFSIYCMGHEYKLELVAY